MNSKNLKGSIILLVASMIWGFAFVCQSQGMDYAGPFSFNSSRMLISGVALLPVVFIVRGSKVKKAENRNEDTGNVMHYTLIGGLCCGILLFISSSFQQCGLVTTTAGKAGFITALYVVFVPVIGLFLKKKIPFAVWICIFTAIIGFFLLSITEKFTISVGDILELLCAISFSFHIIAVDRFNTKGIEPVMMSCIQFFVAGILMLAVALVFEDFSVSALMKGWLPILYMGICSGAIGYTFQIIGQKYTNSTLATLIMSLESVFAALSGWIVLHEIMSVREIIGCFLVFGSVVAAQLVPQNGKNEKSTV